MQGRVEYFRLFQGPKREKDSRHVVWQTQTCLKAFDTEKVHRQREWRRRDSGWRKRWWIYAKG